MGVGGNSVEAVTVLANVISILYGVWGPENNRFLAGLNSVKCASLLFGA